MPTNMSIPTPAAALSFGCHVLPMLLLLLLLLGPEGRLHGVDDLRVEPHATEVDKPLGPNDVRVRVGWLGLVRLGQADREKRGRVSAHCFLAIVCYGSRGH